MISALSAAQAGLSRSSASIAVAAHNVANLNTDGFRAQRLGGAGNLEPRRDTPPAADIPGSDVDLTEEIVDMKLNEKAFRANVAVLRTANRMSGELLDILA